MQTALSLYSGSLQQCSLLARQTHVIGAHDLLPAYSQFDLPCSDVERDPMAHRSADIVVSFLGHGRP